ncbi:fungal-specific transcription factor domain-containing protein [Mariannaea sp. PMI_226]|nr:fungal-specific transcription factor domain-containing protein [Mariannaea sp. PMI_226]
MKRATGPLDKRKKVTRCQACAKRHIKCEGGVPCNYCIRTNKTCQTQQPASHDVRFVAFASKSTRTQSHPLINVPTNLHTHDDVLYLNYFALFMQRCQFTRRFIAITSDLLPLVHTSPSLRDLTLAIGALEASRRGSVELLTHRASPKYTAFSKYGKFLQALHSRLNSADAPVEEDTLWITFLLGIFELISEPSGDRWAKHMLYGMAKMIQLAGPAMNLSPLSMKLLEAFRQLEISRAIIYGDNTFLSQKLWLTYPENGTSDQVDFTEASLDLMLQTSSFSKRFFEEVEAIPENARHFHPRILNLASEGNQLQHELEEIARYMRLKLDAANSFTKLAMVNNHATLLFLCRNFTFYSCWDGTPIPSLSRDQVETHVTGITTLSKEILEESHIPGTSLLFPLRMAGACENGSGQRGIVTAVLDQIYRQGFVVSERIKVDLQQCWEYEDSIKNE